MGDDLFFPSVLRDRKNDLAADHLLHLGKKVTKVEKLAILGGTPVRANKIFYGRQWVDDKDIEAVQDQVLSPIVDAFKQYPLSDESVAEMTGQYVAKLHAGMDIKATVKKDDKTNPVVELTATTLNQEGAAKVAENNADLVALGTAYGELQAQGLTEEQLKASPEFQEFALESINKFIDEFPLNPESSIEITCEAVEGSDGKLYWAPKNPEEVAKFVTGQK